MSEETPVNEFKTVKLTGEDLFNAGPALTSLSQCKMPAKTSYWVSRAISKITPKVKELNDRRNDIIVKFGEEQEFNGIKTGQYQVTPDNMAAFNAEIKAMLQESFDIEIMPISIEGLGNAEVQPSDLIALSWLFVD